MMFRELRAFPRDALATSEPRRHLLPPMQLSIITPLFNRLDLTRAFVAALPGSLPPGLEWSAC